MNNELKNVPEYTSFKSFSIEQKGKRKPEEAFSDLI